MEPSFSEQSSVSVGQDLAALKERITALEAKLNQEQKEVKSEVKIEQVKQAISDYVKEVQQVPSFAPPASTRDEASEIKDKPVPEQVGALVSLALTSGLNRAIAVASDLDNPAILDELHDILVDNYFTQLVQMGIIKLM